jgi:hypothetical protein
MPASNPAIVERNVTGASATRETWLRPNRRAICFGCVPPLILATISSWFAFGIDPSGQWRWMGIAFLTVNIGVIVVLLRHLRRPRIAFQNESVLFFLRGGPPIAVPVNVVEAFFAGQSPAHLPGLAKQPQTVNLIARLSQRCTEWTEQSVKPALGQWRDSYVTIRGTWCEPLDAEVIRRLNRRLKEVKDATPPTTNHD